MKTTIRLSLVFVALASFLWTHTALSAPTILQGAGANYVAFEAEENVNVTLTPGTPTVFAITNDTAANGGSALIAAGANGTATPSSLATYQIRFRTAGTYKLFFRWRANEAYTVADLNTGNSFQAPTRFGTGTNVADYTISTVNNTRNAPLSHVYDLGSENATLLTVSQAQVDAGVPLNFTIGTREAGFMFDRIVLTTEAALTAAQFDALVNSDTDVFVQPAGANYVAFEAENKVAIITGTPTVFAITNDTAANGGSALIAAGANGTATPSSLATYQIRFRTAGTYKLFFRWRANEAYTVADLNTGNSFQAPTRFGTGTNVADYTISTVNNTRNAPVSHVYDIGSENATLLTVSQAQVDAGVPLNFTIGTREAGFMFDRIVLTTESTLTAAQFDALENTGAAVPPVITRVVGSGSLTNVTVSFSKVLEPISVEVSAFRISGGVTVQEVILDPNTLRDVTLITSTQTPGTLYTLTVNDITDASGTFIKANTMTNFFAWRLVNGFSRREVYLGVSGSDIGSLLSAPKFPNSPDQVDVVQGLASVNLLRAGNYGVRLSGYFTPSVTGRYDFFMYSDNEARLSLSTDASPEGLQTILTSPSGSSMTFNPAVFGSSPGQLVAGTRYYIQALLKQGDDFDAFVNVTARRQGDTTPVETLPPLSSQLSVFVDPAIAIVNITRQPTNVIVTAGNRARFNAAATSPGGPVFYQWQLNGTNIAGATRAAIYTPELGTADTGRQYRVIVSGGGATATSAVATVTVNAGPAPALQPYIGANFIGGAAGIGYSGILRSNDVAGVVPQGNYNNVAGGTANNVVLNDANGAPTPVTISYTAATYVTGTGESTAENLLFQGYLHNANGGFAVTLRNVPAGTYNLIAYSVGFNFNFIYDQLMQLTGGTAYPPFQVRAEHAGTYNAAPSIFRRMSSTNAAARDEGNYVVFENVSPDAAGTLTLAVTNQETVLVGSTVGPALSGLQLLRVNAVAVAPALSITRSGTNITIGWTATATGYVLESSGSVPGTNWQVVGSAPNPITGAGTVVTNSAGGTGRFYRLRK